VSGFAGIIRLESGVESAEVDRPEIEQMARAIAFRGLTHCSKTLQTLGGVCVLTIEYRSRASGVFATLLSRRENLVSWRRSLRWPRRTQAAT